MARLEDKFKSEITKELMTKFEYSSVMQVPKIEKIVINMGVGDAVQNSKALDNAVAELALISGQKPLVTRAKKSIATNLSKNSYILSPRKVTLAPIGIPSRSL